MGKIHGSSKSKISLTFSVFMNVFLFIILRSQANQKRSLEKLATGEAEDIGSIYCSGHGRAFMDGLLGGDGKPVCECNACFTGSDCSEEIRYCQLDVDSGDPMFLEPFWLKHATVSGVTIPGWHRMSYEFSDRSLISEQLLRLIKKLHSLVGNANTEGRYIIFGGGATHLLNAAVHALSSNDKGDDSPFASWVVASIPYYPVYREQTEFFKSKDYKFSSGDTSSIKNKVNSSENYIEIVTSPNNPDGQLKKAILKGESVNMIHDLAYYWPHFTPIPSPADENLMIFTLSKLTGHAGSRFGWAIVKDKTVYEKMLTYVSLSTYGVPRETQLRVMRLLQVVVEGEGKEMFEFGFRTMSKRWKKLSKALSVSARFSLQEIEPQYCSFSHQIKPPSPAFAWVKCERGEEDKDCYETLKSEGNLTWRRGSLFGAENEYVRLSLVGREDEFDLLHERVQMLVERENLRPTSLVLQHNRTYCSSLSPFVQVSDSILPLEHDTHPVSFDSE